ncbi:MAG: class I SAM-dependent methyltransferase [Clostridiales bacterium]|nr:class I SAM-dependent methyltransferase [Clostridiales bacterium]
METTSIYESELFLNLPDKSMHPGGLRLTARAARLAGLKPGMTAADIGCGAGATAAFLERALGVRAVGLDASRELIARGRKEHPGLDLLHWDGGALPFESGALDAAFCECTLSVIGAPEALLKDIARALKPGGVFIVSEVCLAPSAPYGGLYTEEELARLIEGAGLAVERREDHTDALRTFAAELRLRGGAGALGALVCPSCLGASEDAPRPRLKDLRYVLFIARKLS